MLDPICLEANRCRYLAIPRVVCRIELKWKEAQDLIKMRDR
jgi:hypothetical protein